MRAARSLKTFPALPVLESEEAAPFVEGQLVKIRKTSEEEAKRVFDASGIHWNSQKAQLLGSIGHLRSVAENYYAVYTPDRSDWWRWPLSMLQEVEVEESNAFDHVNFQQGHLVKIRKLDPNEVQRLCSVPDTLPWDPNLPDEVEGVTWKPSMASLVGSVGKVSRQSASKNHHSSSNFQGHLLHLDTAEFHICNGCGCGLSDTAAHCANCQQHFCSHCAQDQEDLFRPAIEVGTRVRFLRNAAEVSWNQCPGEPLPFEQGDLCRVSELHGEWFRSGPLWAPLQAVQVFTDDTGPNDDDDLDTKEVDEYGRDEWASTSTELKEKTPMFALVARERLVLCERCWSNVPNVNTNHDKESTCAACALCHDIIDTNLHLRPSYRERWELTSQTPGLDEICPKEAWSQEMGPHEGSSDPLMRKQMAVLVDELTRQRAEIQQLRWEKDELRRELELSRA